MAKVPFVAIASVQAQAINDNDVDGEARGVCWSVSQNLGRAPVAAVMERCEVAAASSVWERR